MHRELCDVYFEAIQHGKKVRIDLEKHSCWIDGKVVIENGKVIDENISCTYTDLPLENWMREIENAYQKYKHSIPSEETDSQRHPYFKALPYEELEDVDMLYGEERASAQQELVFLVFRLSLNPSFHWDEEVMGGKWFWQSKYDKDLVILRSWLEIK